MEGKELFEAARDLLEVIPGNHLSAKTAAKRMHQAQVLIDKGMAKAARAPEQGGEMREAVRWFAGEMERKLKANDHKGGLGECSEGYLFRRLREELDELQEALLRENAENITSEAADVANIAMMLADNSRALLARESAEPAEERGPEVGE